MAIDMLTDRFGRVHDYLRIAVTDRCNYGCVYCMPEDGIDHGPHAAMLSYEEIARLSEIFVGLGVRKIRLTGGEPLVRHGITRLFGMLSGLGVELALSTNGSQLEHNMDPLWQHRFHQLNISLDTMRADRFRAIAGRDESAVVQRAIRAAARYRSHNRGFRSVKINTVVMRGVNEDELLDFVQFGEELSVIAEGGPAIEMRFIEYMPFRGNAWSAEQCVPMREMLAEIEQVYDLQSMETSEATGSRATQRSAAIHPGPAKSFAVGGSNLRIGFITTVSEPFCSDCSRLRLTADGTMRTCLFGDDGVNLRDMLRHGASKDAIASAITGAVQDKWLEHPPVHELANFNTREMIAIGG